MGDNIYHTVEILFFGAGVKGRYWLEYARSFGIVPKGMVDNDRELWGEFCENVLIYSPDNLRVIPYDYILITCGREEEIHQQLSELGVEEDKIVAGDHNILSRLLFQWVSGNVLSAPSFLRNKVIQEKLPKESKILFDLQNGMVLGGVESWVYDLAKEMKKNSRHGYYLTTDTAGPGVKDSIFPARIFNFRELDKEKDKIKLCVKEIMENLPCTIICNFPQTIFWAACLAKRHYPDQVRVVAVQHSDDSLYFETYSLWQEYIDRCLVISICIEKKLLACGMEKEKIGKLGWQVPCEEKLDRKWSAEGTCLRIGYAGRITITQKRVDLLPVLAAELRKRGIRFQMNIAGTGNYVEALEERIKEESLQEYIILAGYIERNDIPLFWKRQDIMVSCSEWEGHSISQAEAMAGGAVPVLTDVSGARDDVADGYNGFIVEVGDIEGLADRICWLYHDRGILEQMGKNAHGTICGRQQQMDQTAYWTGLLEEVWQR